MKPNWTKQDEETFNNIFRNLTPVPPTPTPTPTAPPPIIYLPMKVYSDDNNTQQDTTTL